jgi:sugar (pentulose or hexulose) kinase
VDGEPVVTARYGGGYDFRHVRGLVMDRCGEFPSGADEKHLENIAAARDSFLLPNINPSNHGTGPFPEVRGRILGEDRFFNESGAACIVTNLSTALTAAVQVEMVSPERDTPLVITAGGARDPLFGRLLASFTGRAVYALVDRNGSPVTETTALGAAMVGKAARLGRHPYEVDTGTLGVSFRPVEPFQGATVSALEAYRGKWIELVHASGSRQSGSV